MSTCQRVDRRMPCSGIIGRYGIIQVHILLAVYSILTFCAHEDQSQNCAKSITTRHREMSDMRIKLLQSHIWSVVLRFHSMRQPEAHSGWQVACVIYTRMKGLARSCVLKYVTLKANPDHLSSNVEYVHQSRSFAMVGLYTPDSLAVFATLPNFRVKQAITFRVWWETMAGSGLQIVLIIVIPDR